MRGRGFRVGRAGGGAVVAGGVGEACRTVEVGRGGEQGSRRLEHGRDGDGVGHAEDGERLSALVGRAGGVVAEQGGERDGEGGAVLGDRRQAVAGGVGGVVDLGDGERRGGGGCPKVVRAAGRAVVADGVG